MTPLTPASPKLTRAISAVLRRFLDTESSAAKLLAVATVGALVWANSPFGSTYGSFWEAELPSAFTLGGRIADPRHLVNEALMAVFFFVVGLEIKRELVVGELSHRRVAALPMIAAIGGMVLPAVIYLALNAGTDAASGWAIPIATDIAFALALVALVGERVPTGVKVFLLSLAIVDDIGAITVIAIFYTDQIEVIWLTGLAIVVGAAWWSTKARVLGGWAVAAIATAAWFCALFAGIHPTIAAVLVALVLTMRDDEGPAIEQKLHPWAGFVVLPLFALANAGVGIDLSTIGASISSRQGLGIVTGLVMGKLLGIIGFSWIGVRTGIASLPAGVTWRHLFGAAAAAGIGFSVSLFITDLSFEDVAAIDAAKLSVFIGSLVAALIGYVVLRGSPANDS